MSPSLENNLHESRMPPRSPRHSPHLDRQSAPGPCAGKPGRVTVLKAGESLCVRHTLFKSPEQEPQRCIQRSRDELVEFLKLALTSGSLRGLGQPPHPTLCLSFSCVERGRGGQPAFPHRASRPRRCQECEGTLDLRPRFPPERGNRGDIFLVTLVRF